MQPASAAATESNNDVNDAEAPRQKKERQGAEETSHGRRQCRQPRH